MKISLYWRERMGNIFLMALGMSLQSTNVIEKLIAKPPKFNLQHFWICVLNRVEKEEDDD